MKLTIENFWRPVLQVKIPTLLTPVRGWNNAVIGLDTFVEAPLVLSTQLSEGNDPYNSQVLLVSAPGAVGKSTLAREIAAATRAIYIDLATSDPVGANTLSGGLAKSGLYVDWKEGQTTVLIDGLDEARLRVTQEAFEAFLQDVASLCLDRRIPVVLFGRTGAVQDAWLILEGTVRTAVLEIGYYEPADAIKFTYAKLRSLKRDHRHEEAERKAIELLLEKLRTETKSDGDTFAGYAPVLQAVAERVSQEDNAIALVSSIEKGGQPITLQTVVSAILDRERGKLNSITFDDNSLATKLYSQNEQLEHLVARVFKSAPPIPIVMNSTDAQKYDAALNTWVPEHPFLNGRDEPSSAVFEAMILVAALHQKTTGEQAVKSQIARGAAANPFLAEFYSSNSTSDEQPFLPGEHIGIIYSSLRSRLSLGETASLLVEAPEDAENEEALKAEVEITLAKRGADASQILRFDTDQTGILRLGIHVEDVEISTPHAKIEIGPGPEATLVAPVSIECFELVLNAPKLIVDASISQDTATVSLIAERYTGSVTSVPIVRGGATLAASWPGVRNHPWASFAATPATAEDQRLNETLRRFRKFVIAFRSHSKGSLARLKDKIDHERMTKGQGQAVLDLMKQTGIISTVGAMYHLDPDKLGSETGATYADCMSKRFGEKTIAFVQRAYD